MRDVTRRQVTRAAFVVLPVRIMRTVRPMSGRMSTGRHGMTTMGMTMVLGVISSGMCRIGGVWRRPARRSTGVL